MFSPARLFAISGFDPNKMGIPADGEGSFNLTINQVDEPPKKQPYWLLLVLALILLTAR